MSNTNTKLALDLVCFLFLALLSTIAVAAPFPRVDLQASATVIQSGGGIRLTWTTSNVTRCDARGAWYGQKELNGGWSLNGLLRNHEYQLVCTGPGGTAMDTVSVSISGKQPPSSSDPDPISSTPSTPPAGNQPWIDLQTSDASVSVGGGVRLTWTSQNVTSCQAGGDYWRGTMDVNGGWNMSNLSRTHTYSLTCNGPAGQTTDSITVYVGEPAPSDNIAGSGGQTGSGTGSGSSGGSGSDSGTDSESPPTTTPSAPPGGNQPWVDLQTSDASVSVGGGVRLTWTSQNVTSCQAGGDYWRGNMDVNGGWNMNNLARTHTYSLTCDGPAGQTTDSITVYVGEPAPSDNIAGSGGQTGSGTGSESSGGSGSDSGSGSGSSSAIQPTVTLALSEALVNAGDTTRLSWSSENAATCRASAGPWSGMRGTSGSESSGQLYSTTTYTLECSNGGLSAISMVTVSVAGQMTVRWRAPTETTDGSPLTDLAGYRIYFGERSRDYQDYVEVMNPNATQHSFDIPAGSYRVAMTAVDREGRESDFSNEVLLTTQ